MPHLAVRDPFTEMRSFARRFFDDPLICNWVGQWDDWFADRARVCATIPLAAPRGVDGLPPRAAR